MSFDKVKRSILKDIVPTTVEKRKVSLIQKKLLSKIKNQNVKPIFCGSIAKNTWLSGHKDIDLFLLFNSNEGRSTLERVGISTAKKIIEDSGGKWEMAYSEHPYVLGFIDGHNVDIVPAYDVEPSKIKSSVDRTPHHLEYVNKTMEKGMENEIRLLKAFCKGIGVYGSNLKTEGFSGYLCELLVIRYGSFLEVLEAAAEWETGTVIDIETFYMDPNFPKSKFNTPLVMIDPVDRDRNVSSVLSARNFFKFRKESRRFLDDPGTDYFYPREEESLKSADIIKLFESRNTKLIFIKFEKPDLHEDIVWTQLRKFSNRIKNILEDHEFMVLRNDNFCDETHCITIFELLNHKLPKIEKKIGPSVMDTQNSNSFAKRYRGNNIFIENDKLVVENFRPYTNVLDLLVAILHYDYNGLHEMGVPTHIAKSIDKNVDLITDNDIYKLIATNNNLSLFLTKYLKGNDYVI